MRRPVERRAHTRRRWAAVIVAEADLPLEVAQAHALGDTAGVGVKRVRARHAVVDEVLKRLGRELAVDELDGAALDLVVQRGDGLVDGVLEGEALDVDLLGLAEPVDAPRRLRLLRQVRGGRTRERLWTGRADPVCARPRS